MKMKKKISKESKAPVKKVKETGAKKIGKGRKMPIGGGSAAGIQKGVKKGGY